MTEGQKPRIADQQIECAGKDREAEHVHQENRIDEEWREQKGDDHSTEVPGGKAGGAPVGACGNRSDRWRGGRHAVLPNSPAGLIMSTMAMMTKITVLEASG